MPPLPIPPLHDLAPERWRRVRGVLTDIDDTLTVDGRLDPAARQALQALQAARLPVIAITGRPAGWSEPCATGWPLAAVVAENGGVMLRLLGGRLQHDFVQDEATRAANLQRLQTCARAVLHEVPGATLARDSAGRLTDIAVDHAEHAQLPPEAVEAVVRVMRRHGLQATVSSIHVNGWIGSHTKWTGARWAVEQTQGHAFDPADWVYVGDSTNDELMFEHLPLSVGVANLARFVDRLRHRPSAITPSERGRGFAEVAACVLAAHAGGA